MTAGLGPCAYCGRPAQERHHFTARATFDGPYLDSGSTISLCRRCHVTEGQVWREVGLDRVEDPLAARVQRVTWTAGRLADLRRPWPAESMRGLHEVLVTVQGDVLAQLGVEGSL